MRNIEPKSDTPKAILYSFPPSIWASAVLLGLEEKGFGKDEIDIKTVNLLNGDNLDPAYLRINPNGTVPTLVVPLEKTLSAPDVEVKYKALTETKKIIEFLDKSRTVISKTRTTSHAPAPALTPVSIELSDLNNDIVTLLHSQPADPNFLSLASGTLSSSSPSELAASTSPHTAIIKVMFSNRVNALKTHLEALTSDSPDSESSNPASQKTIDFLKQKLTLSSQVNSIFHGLPGTPPEQYAAAVAATQPFFQTARAAWSAHLPQVLDELNSKIIGPLALGDQVSLADLHMMAWLARVVSCADGKNEKEGVKSIEEKVNWVRKEDVTKGNGEGVEVKEWKVGEKIVTYWETILERKSFKEVYRGGLH